MEANNSKVWKRSQLDWRLAYDHYLFRGIWRYQLDGGDVEDYRESDKADWINSRLTYRFDAEHFGSVTAVVAFELAYGRLTWLKS